MRLSESIFYLFPKREFLRTHRVGPLGLSGFLFPGLLVLYFYHLTNRDIYLVSVYFFFIFFLGGGGD